MRAVGLEGIDTAVQQAHIWINDLDERLHWKNKARAYRLLKAVLHAVRDRLQVNEAVNLGAQLPTLIRGAYYDQWHPASTPTKDRHLDAFVTKIEHSFRNDPLAFPTEGISAVLALLTDKVSAGEIADVRNSLPGEIRSLWPDAHGNAASPKQQQRSMP